jgi:hypothetical protein
MSGDKSRKCIHGQPTTRSVPLIGSVSDRPYLIDCISQFLHVKLHRSNVCLEHGEHDPLQTLPATSTETVRKKGSWHITRGTAILSCEQEGIMSALTNVSWWHSFIHTWPRLHLFPMSSRSCMMNLPSPLLLADISSCSSQTYRTAALPSNSNRKCTNPTGISDPPPDGDWNATTKRAAESLSSVRFLEPFQLPYAFMYKACKRNKQFGVAPFFCHLDLHCASHQLLSNIAHHMAAEALPHLHILCCQLVRPLQQFRGHVLSLIVPELHLDAIPIEDFEGRPPACVGPQLLESNSFIRQFSGRKKFYLSSSAFSCAAEPLKVQFREAQMSCYRWWYKGSETAEL